MSNRDIAWSLVPTSLSSDTRVEIVNSIEEALDVAEQQGRAEILESAESAMFIDLLDSIGKSNQHAKGFVGGCLLCKIEEVISAFQKLKDTHTGNRGEEKL